MKKIMLVGAPNVGKSVIFQALTGKNATVSNYPGTTVEITTGLLRNSRGRFSIMDTPGIYSLEPLSEEEAVTCRILAADEADLIVQVVDAKNLSRMLPLTLSLLKRNIPLIVALNMMDEAIGCGIRIDFRALSEVLQVPVIPMTAVKGHGVQTLTREIMKNGFAVKHEPILSDRRLILQRTVKTIPRKKKLAFFDWLGKVTREPVRGSLILAFVLYFGLYQIVGKFGAGVLVDTLQAFFDFYITPQVVAFVNAYALWDWLRTLLIGEYGLYTMGFCYAFCIVLPIVGLFFSVFAFLEDCGYLPRLALLSDVLLKKIGLNGRAVIPFSLGFGCGTMAVLVTRILGTRRERLLTAFLLALAIPCSAQLGILLGLLSNRPDLFYVWFFYILLVFVMAGFLGNQVLPGHSSPFYMELPPMRCPKLQAVACKTYQRVLSYFKEILPLFLLMSGFLTILDAFGMIEFLIRFFVPMLDWIGLPGAFAPILLLGFFRRDYGAAGLYGLWSSAGLSDGELLVAATLLTLSMPCAAQAVVLVKEQGVRMALSMIVIIFSLAFFSAWFMRGVYLWLVL